MSDQSTSGLRSAVAAALDAPLPEGEARFCLRLHLALAVAANQRGLVLRTRERLARELIVDESLIDEGLARLSSAGLVEVKAPSPYLVIALRFWSADASTPASIVAENKPASAFPIEEVPVSSKQQLAAAATPGVAAACGEGGAGEGAALLDEARAVLGTEAEDDLPALLARYPAPVVRRALRRVRLTPPSRIRASKSALLRFLLDRFSHEPHAQLSHPDHHA